MALRKMVSRSLTVSKKAAKALKVNVSLTTALAANIKKVDCFNLRPSEKDIRACEDTPFFMVSSFRIEKSVGLVPRFFQTASYKAANTASPISEQETSLVPSS